jgi:hypothetical protein
MIKRLERLKNTVNKYMADLRPTSQNGSWSEVVDLVYYCMPLDDGRMTETYCGNNIGRAEKLLR